MNKEKLQAIFLTKSQIDNLVDFFDFEFIPSIRNDVDIDDIEYLVSMMGIYKELKEKQEELNAQE